MPIDAFLFDKDGTLFDFAATWTAWSARLLEDLSEGDEGRAAAMAEVIGFDRESESFRPDSIAIACSNGEIAVALAPHVRQMTVAELESYLGTSAADASLTEAVPLAAFLDGLKARGKFLGVMTNDAEISAIRQLERVNVKDRFDFIAGFDSGHGAKPDPDPLLAFCKAIGTTPERTAMVGDSRHDMEAGAAAGMKRIAVLTGLAGHDDLAPYADVVLPNIGHIPAWLDG